MYQQEMFEESDGRGEVMMGYIKLVLFAVATLSPCPLALTQLYPMLAGTTRSLSATIETKEVYSSSFTHRPTLYEDSYLVCVSICRQR